MPSTSLGFGIIGAGMIARYHAQAIAATPGSHLVAMTRHDPARRRETEAEFDVPCEPSLDALLARPDVDVVTICTPSGQHAAQTVAAARAGKHVLVEKPMALSLADAEAMIQACRAAGVTLGVAFQRRTSPTYQTLHAAMQAGELGRPVLAVVTIPYVRSQSYYDSAAWRGTWALDGGGPLMNQGIHLVDVLVWLMGDVVEVAAHDATLTHAIEVEDTLTASLRFANGALGVIAATTSAAPGFPHRLEVYGDRGGVQTEGDTITRWDDERGSRIAPSGATVGAEAGASPTGIGVEGHTRLVGDLVAAIREGREPLVSGVEGRRSLALTLAVYEAAGTGRPVPVR